MFLNKGSVAALSLLLGWTLSLQDVEWGMVVCPPAATHVPGSDAAWWQNGF